MEDDKGPAIACVYAMRDLLTINAGQLAVEEGEVRVYFDIRYPVTASGETVFARMRRPPRPTGCACGSATRCARSIWTKTVASSAGHLLWHIP